MKIDLKNKKVLVMGLGVHGGGLGVAKWLASAGAKVVVTDLRTKEQLKDSLKELKGLPIKYVLGQHRAEDFKTADLIIKNPGVPNDSPFLKVAQKSGVPVETDMSLFFLQCPAPIIGITGTKGKTTTTTLVGEIFKAAKRRPVIAGNIRVSPLDYLKKIKAKDSIILELSSWQLEGLEKHKFSPHLSVITNLYPDHLNRYRSYAHYVRAKALIFKFQTPGDVCVLNRDNKESRFLGKMILGQRFWFSKKFFPEENGSYRRGEWLYYREDGREGKIMPVKEIKILGEHNLENILAAVILARVSRISTAVIRKTVKNFAGVPYRLELIRNYRGIKYYNDTAATAPEAAERALKTLGGKKKNIVILAGGADKKLDFGNLAKAIKKYAKTAILFKGTATPKLKKELLKLNYWAITEAGSMSEAISDARKVSRSGDIVLLSPGCASFGLFNNEFDRGDQFTAAVKKIS